jgi:transcription-repair coupling factor (superfamily II helicase)
MHAQAGDWLVMESRDLGHHARRGQILSVHSPDGAPPYRVRWTDDGHETLVVPGPDTHVVTATAQAETDAAEAERRAAE